MNQRSRRESIREKPHRLSRQAYQGEVVASIAVCVDGRVPLFTDPTLVAEFVRILHASAERWFSVVPVYCFMPEHLHLVLEGRAPEADVWRLVTEYKQRTGYWMSLNIPGVSWQKGFYDHIIRKSEELADLVRYISDNPCRKGLVSHWRDYPYKGAVGYELEDIIQGM